MPLLNRHGTERGRATTGITQTHSLTPHPASHHPLEHVQQRQIERTCKRSRMSTDFGTTPRYRNPPIIEAMSEFYFALGLGAYPTRQSPY